MKPKFYPLRGRAVACPLILSFVFTLSPADAQWIGSGVSGGGTGNILNDTANWNAATINGDFSGINQTGTTSLVLGSNLTAANGTAISKTLAAAFVSGATTIELADASGIRIGWKIAGTGIPTGSYVREIAGNVITLGLAATAASGTGSYTFTPVALDFNFGDSDILGTSTASGVDLQIASDVPGTARTVTLSGSVLMSQRTNPANQITTSEDIGYTLAAQAVWGRMGGDATTDAPTSPTYVINGPLNLGSYSTTNSRLVLEGGNLTVNGLISGGANGTGAAINFGSSGAAGTLTLTNPGNSFPGNITTSANGALTANSEVPVADSGQPSALGAGTTIGTNNRSINLAGFTNPVSTNRRWNIGGGSGRLNNNGSAPVYLTGEVTNSVATGSAILGGSYLNRALPSRITGSVFNGSSAAGLTVAAGVWEVTNDGNSFTRLVQVTGSNSTLRFTSIANAGVNSSLGQGPSITLAAPGSSGAANYFEFVGNQDGSTDRAVSLAGNVSSSNLNSIVANGEGTLEFTGAFSSQSLTVNNNGTRTLVLEGAGDGVLSGSADFADKTAVTTADPPVTYTGKVGILKRGSGTWTISGSNFNHTGQTSLQAGTTVLDYSVNNQLAASAGLTLNGGNLTVTGKETGATAVTLPPITIGDSGTVPDYNSFQLVTEGGADGVSLTISSIATAGSTIRCDLIDISGNAANTVALAALTDTSPVTNGLLMTSSSGRSTIVLKDSGGYGFPVRDDVTGLLSRFAGAEALPTTGFANTKHYLLSGGATVDVTAQLLLSTLEVDTSGGDAAINLGANVINGSGSGRGVLLSGENDFTLSATGTSLNSNSIFIHNYLQGEGTFRINGNLGTGATFILGGNGHTEYTGDGLAGGSSGTAGLSLLGGVFTVLKAQDVSLLVPRIRVSNAIFEIGADLNGGTAGDFSNAIGIETAGRIAFYYNSGLSAVGGHRVVDFGGDGRLLTWGRAGFLTVGDTDADGGFTLRLSTERADGTIEIANPIDLNAGYLHGRRRTVEVADGGAAIDAVLSGAISGESRLRKTGKGTLLLSGTNTYSGGTTVLDGRLLLGAGVSAGPVMVRGGGTIGGTGNAGATVIDGTLEVEISGAVSSKLNVAGNLTITEGSTLAVVLNGAATETSYVIAEYTGTLAGTFGNVPAGYTVDYSQANKIVLQPTGAPANAYTVFIGAAYPDEDDAEVIGADKDPDHDGLVNAIEFVLNSDPAGGAQENLPRVTKSGGNLLFTFTRRKDAAGAGYATSVEISETLLTDSWSTVTTGIGVVDHPSDPDTLEDVTVTIPVLAPGTKLFARLKVTFP